MQILNLIQARFQRTSQFIWFALVLTLLVATVFGQRTGSKPPPNPNLQLVGTSVWVQTTKPNQTQQELLRELQGAQLQTKVVQVGQGANAEFIIVIYGPNGGCRLCLGKASACKEACPTPQTNPTSLK